MSDDATNNDAGKIYVTASSKDGEVTRFTAPNADYAHALANVLNDIGYKASHVPATCGVYFHRDASELRRVDNILEKVLAIKGGLSIVDLRS